jgi:hypothetical protein
VGRAAVAACVPSASVSRTRPPWPLTASVALVGAEAVALVVLDASVLGSLTGRRAVMGATTAVFFLVYAAALVAGGWLLLRLHSWPRAPIVLAQLIQLGLAWSFRGGGTTVAAVVLGVVALLVLAGVFHPASLAALDTADQDQHRRSG